MLIAARVPGVAGGARGHSAGMTRELSTARDTTAAGLIPDGADLDELRAIAAGCQACHLWAPATQTVFGEGPAAAEIVMVGEQPCDREDREGSPFVGPAGRVLDQGLVDAGIDRDKVFVTNVVKHFKFSPRGKRRIHAKPNAEEITACRPWLEAELTAVSPKVLVCLGSTAAQALIDRKFRVTKQRGQVIEWPDGPPWSDGAPPVKVTATVHPSSILRGPDEAREAAMADFVDDLGLVRRLLTG